MLPTYGRAKTKLPTFIDSALRTVSNKKNICFTFCVNVRDRETAEYLQSRDDIDKEIIIEELPRPHFAKYWNMMYEHHKKTRGEHCLVSMVGDDMEFKTIDWDAKILDTINYFDGIAMVYGDDCRKSNQRLATNHFTTCKLVDAQLPHPYMCEEFAVDYIDAVWHTVTQTLGVLIYLHDVKIFHDHATLHSGNDEVWQRSREVLADAKDAWYDHGNKIISCRVDAITHNLKEIFMPEISVIMTTYDRIELLKATVDSYNSSDCFPPRVKVYDDGSKQIGEVRKLIGAMKNAELIEGEENLGCFRKTPSVLKHEFDCGAQAVFIIDSDTAFSRTWWGRLRSMAVKLRKREDFGFLGLYNQKNINGAADPDIPFLRRNNTMGAFGMMVTKESYEKYVKPIPFEEETISNWDNLACRNAIDDGKVVFCSSPSFLQHIGYSRGTHIGKALVSPSVADDFIGTTLETYTNCRNKKATGTKRILYCLGGRKGDIIAGSMVANQLISMGYKLTWLTIPSNYDLVVNVCPDATVETIPSVTAQDDWGYMDTWMMAEQYTGLGYEFFINAQFGSPENHYPYTVSGLDPMRWLTERVQKIILDKLDSEHRKYLRLKKKNIYQNVYEIISNTGLMELQPHDKLAIIAPEAITSRVMTDDMALSLYEEYTAKGYVTKILVKERPYNIPFRQARTKYLWSLSFVDCIHVIKRSDIFLGNDSGLSWASLYSDGKKFIYHDKSRIDVVNTYFSYLDENAIDLMLDKGVIARRAP